MYLRFSISHLPPDARLSLPFFFFNDTAITEIYTLSLHDALPIWKVPMLVAPSPKNATPTRGSPRSLNDSAAPVIAGRSEEHTSELQSLRHLVCRLLLEKKKINHKYLIPYHTIISTTSCERLLCHG